MYKQMLVLWWTAGTVNTSKWTSKSDCDTILIFKEERLEMKTFFTSHDQSQRHGQRKVKIQGNCETATA